MSVTGGPWPGREISMLALTQLLEPPPPAPGSSMSVDPDRAARLAAVLGELLERGDLALAFGPRGMAGGQSGDQALDPVADLEREMRGRGARQGADVLRGHRPGPSQQLRVLGLAHQSPPIFASSARLSISACCPTSMASWSPITQTWL